MAYFSKMDLYDSQVVLSVFVNLVSISSELIAMPRQLIISLHNKTGNVKIHISVYMGNDKFTMFELKETSEVKIP